MNEPSMFELVRRLDEITQQQAAMLARLDLLLRDVAQTYATKESMLAALALRDIKIDELEKDNESAAGFRRQVAAGFIVGFLLLLVPLLGVLNKAIGAG